MTVFRAMLTLVRYPGDTWISKIQEIACFEYCKSMRNAILKINRGRIVHTVCSVEFTLETKHNALWEQESRQNAGYNMVTDIVGTDSRILLYHRKWLHVSANYMIILRPLLQIKPKL